MARLARAVHVKDPARPGRTILLSPGEEPATELAVQILNPRAWEGGQVPAAVRRHLAAQKASQAETGQAGQGDPAGSQGNGEGDPGGPGGADTTPAEPEPKQAAPKKTAARKPAPSRTAAAEGTGGQ